MAYFTAVLARAGSTWRARDVDLDEGGSLEGVGDLLRAVAVGDEPVLAVLEHEDEWFALFRADADEDPRLFVSDYPAASSSGYAELLAPAAEVELPDDDPAPPPAVPPADDEDAAPAPAAVAVAAAWAGDADLLDDLGVSGEALRRLAEEHEEDPAGALADLGDTLGFADILEALR